MDKMLTLSHNCVSQLKSLDLNSYINIDKPEKLILKIPEWYWIY